MYGSVEFRIEFTVNFELTRGIFRQNSGFRVQSCNLLLALELARSEVLSSFRFQLFFLFDFLDYLRLGELIHLRGLVIDSLSMGSF